MTTRKFTGVLILSIIAVTLFCCKPVEVILHGDITGLVTDATTSEPIEAASVKLNQTDDSTSTGSDGTYLLKNLTPGNYEIEASKFGYATWPENVEVVKAETKNVDFALNGIPVPNPSVACLDFGLDSTSRSFAISNIGKGKLTYVFTTSQDWITVHPSSGEVTNETDIITVTVNRTGLSENIYKETIKITSFAGQVLLTDIIIPVYLNGVADCDCNYYKVVRIGTQTWMAENLNVGFQIGTNTNSSNNGIIEKYCYNNSPSNCNIYGGLYQWDEMIQYNPSDNGTIGSTQGICPDGWHIPTNDEWWLILINGLGGGLVAGGKLEEIGTAHWHDPNVGATNESGFSGLPGGSVDPLSGDSSYDMGVNGNWWSSTEYPGDTTIALSITLMNSLDRIPWSANFKQRGLSVRCLKNPGKR